jgi:hypothetical protein
MITDVFIAISDQVNVTEYSIFRQSGAKKPSAFMAGFVSLL